MTANEAVQFALEHHRAGRLAEAETFYRQALARDPACFDAWHMLGAVALQTGNAEAAAQLLLRALAINPGAPEALGNLGVAWKALGRFDEAVEAHREAIRRGFNSVDAFRNLGAALEASGRLEEAIAILRRAVELAPAQVDARLDLGDVLLEAGHIDSALSEYREAGRLDANSPAALFGQGAALQAAGRFADALQAYDCSLALEPDHAGALMNRANVLCGLGRFEEALSDRLRLVQLAPDLAPAYNNLGSTFDVLGRRDEAVEAYQNALRLDAKWMPAYNNLAGCYRALGRLSEAIELYREAIAIDPREASLHANLVYTLHFHPDYDAHGILQEARNWEARHARPLQAAIQPHENAPDPDRRLRVGYVSPNFCRHVVGQNLIPFFREHDHSQFEIFCYSDDVASDALTEEFRARADHWRNIAGLTDEQRAELIRADRIDILVDLTLHMALNHLLVFARKPAPVQVTYLGYCSTTGLKTMDYRLSDPYLDPPGADLTCYQEKTFRLARSYWSYEPLGEAPAAGPLPASTSGTITFGCLNNFAKVSPPALETWAKILQKTPSSRLLLFVPEGSCRERVRRLLDGGGISRERVEFVAFQSWEGYVPTVQRIDIALDPFPYCGGITTCDALWMGVPVVTLSGRTAVSGAGRSILSNVGLPELIAETPEQYIEIAVTLANDRPRLAELRSTLRNRMECSPLRDAKGHACEIETSYREMWRRWCVNPSSAEPN